MSDERTAPGTDTAAGRADRACLFLATGFGLGRIPFAPGTFGSLLGLPLAWGVQHLPWEWRLVAAAAVFLCGVPLCGRAARRLRAKDPGMVVFDEIAAFPAIYVFVAFNGVTAVLGFLLFRVFDILKLWPARRLERLPEGWGIMADDLAAGVYAGAALWCVARSGALG